MSKQYPQNPAHCDLLKCHILTIKWHTYRSFINLLREFIRFPFDLIRTLFSYSVAENNLSTYRNLRQKKNHFLIIKKSLCVNILWTSLHLRQLLNTYNLACRTKTNVIENRTVRGFTWGKWITAYYLLYSKRIFKIAYALRWWE